MTTPEAPNAVDAKEVRPIVIASLRDYRPVHEALFMVARWIRAQPAYDGAPATAATLGDIAGEWYDRAIEVGFPGTEELDVDDVRARLTQAVAAVRYPLGQGVVDVAFDAAMEGHPPAAAMRYASVRTMRLVALCAALARQVGVDQPFYLSCRVAARLLKTDDHTAVARLLALLVTDGVLERVEPGDRPRRRAARYRWMGGAP